MNTYALLRLNGGFASAFGSDASPSRRPTWPFPGRSALTGLIGRIAGVDDGNRQHIEMLERWQRTLRSCAIILKQGQNFSDYQNARIRGASKRDKKTGFLMSPIVSTVNKQIWKNYLSAHDLVVALRFEGAALPSAEEVYQWGLRPSRVPYVGRQCCNLALPLTSAGEPRTAPSALEAAKAAASEIMNGEGQDPDIEQDRQVLAQWDEGEGPAPSKANKASQHYLADLRLWDAFCHGGSRPVIVGKVEIPVLVAQRD